MKTIRVVVAAVIFTLGLTAFVPATYGCGGVGGTGCKTVSAAPFALALVRAIVGAFEIVTP
jgi:hypothetical protein